MSRVLISSLQLNTRRQISRDRLSFLLPDLPRRSDDDSMRSLLTSRLDVPRILRRAKITLLPPPLHHRRILRSTKRHLLSPLRPTRERYRSGEELRSGSRAQQCAGDSSARWIPECVETGTGSLRSESLMYRWPDYGIMRQAGCTRDSTTQRYCFVEAAATSDPSSLYYYQLVSGSNISLEKG